MKMAGLLLLTVLLTSFLSPGDSVAAIDNNGVTRIVKFMMDRYDINSQVGVAVNVPQTQDLNTLQNLFASADTVRNALNSDSREYKGSTMVVAKPRNNVHAEVRVLKNIGPLADNANNHFLVFYSFYSPCATHCMNEGGRYSIIPKINEVFPRWTQFAFVFSDVYGRGDDVKEALKQLGRSNVGYNNVFRCYTPTNGAFQCISCFINQEPVAQCISN